MAHILVVEDNRAIADLIGLYLRRDGHEITAIASGLDAFTRFASDQAAFDLIVLDLMLPGLDGRGLCRRIRDMSTIPILMLTALDDDRDKLHGFDLGADDYLTKPFNPNELVARVRAILRRASPLGPAIPQSVLRSGNIALDLDRRTLTVAGADVPLRTKEFDLLAAFAEHPGVVLSRERLLERVWAGEFDGDTRTVDVHISRLRERLASAGATVSIETIRSIGYRLRDRT
jgi:DNA-binding response OmpR family regulator